MDKKNRTIISLAPKLMIQEYGINIIKLLSMLPVSLEAANPKERLKKTAKYWFRTALVLMFCAIKVC